MSVAKRKKPSELPSKWVRTPDGERIHLKVVESDSETLGEDLLAAFRSNVRSMLEARRKRRNAPDAS